MDIVKEIETNEETKIFKFSIGKDMQEEYFEIKTNKAFSLLILKDEDDGYVRIYKENLGEFIEKLNEFLKIK